MKNHAVKKGVLNMFKDEIARGLLLLSHDQRWAIDIEELDMESAGECVLGQLHGNYVRGKKGLIARYGVTAPAYFGFQGPTWLDSLPDYNSLLCFEAWCDMMATLTAEWKTALIAYRQEHPR